MSLKRNWWRILFAIVRLFAGITTIFSFIFASAEIWFSFGIADLPFNPLPVLVFSGSFIFSVIMLWIDRIYEITIP